MKNIEAGFEAVGGFSEKKKEGIGAKTEKGTEEKKGMSAQELLDELKKWKEGGIKKVQLIFEFGASEEPVNLECMDLNKAKIKGGEILTCKAKITDKTTVGVNFDASVVIGIKEWIASGQANDVYWNKAERNRTIDDDVTTGKFGKGIGANDIKMNKELRRTNPDDAAS